MEGGIRRIGLEEQIQPELALIELVRGIWGDDHEMVYLILWMWCSGEAAEMEPPGDVGSLVEIAASGPGHDGTARLRERLRSLHASVSLDLRAAA